MSKKRLYGKDKVVPNICKNCEYKAMADPDDAEKLITMIDGIESASHIAFETLSRILEDENGGKCPYTADKQPSSGWCGGGHEVCTKKGDDAHRYYRCWRLWIDQIIKEGHYDLGELQKEKA